MKIDLLEYLIKLPFTLIIRAYYKLNPSQYRIDKWKKEGCPVPPPREIKVKTIKKYAELINAKTFIETGTFMGDTTNDMASHLNNVISIELDNDLYEKAVLRFKNKKNVQIIHGDSGIMLPKLLSENQNLPMPFIFWLDGHYSAGNTAKGELETPIIKELESIKLHIHTHKTYHSILIDDANCFTGENDYPTLETMKQYCSQNFPSYSFSIEHNIIVLAP